MEKEKSENNYVHDKKDAVAAIFLYSWLPRSYWRPAGVNRGAAGVNNSPYLVKRVSSVYS
jgi:hypothetical protein